MTEHEELADLQRSMGRVEGKLDALLFSLNQHFADDKVAFSAISNRLSQVERKTWFFTGAAALLGALLAPVLTYMRNFL